MNRILKFLKEFRLLFLVLGLSYLLLVFNNLSVLGATSLFISTPDPIEEGAIDVIFSTNTTHDSYEWWISDGPGDYCDLGHPGETSATITTTMIEKGTWEVCLKVPDNSEPTGYYTERKEVIVNNLPPEIKDSEFWTVDPDPVFVGQPLIVEVPFKDYESSTDDYTCTIDYGDGSGDQTGTINYSEFEYEWLCEGPYHSYANAGMFDVIATIVDDIESYTTSDKFSLTILEENLIIKPEMLPAGEAQTPYTQPLTATDADGNDLANDQVQWDWSSGDLPENCFLNSSTGQFGCSAYYNSSPLPAGTYNFTVYVETLDGSGYGSRDYSLVINPHLVFDPGVLPLARQYQPYTQLITVSGGAGSYSLTKTGDPLPNGILFDEVIDSFTGTPSEAGIFPGIVMHVVDDTSGVSKDQTYALTVLPEHLFTWEPAEPQEGASATFTASDGYISHSWERGFDPGDTCEQHRYNLYGGNPKLIEFETTGEYQVCLIMYDSATEAYIYDNQWVTVINSPPRSIGVNISPQPSLIGTEVWGYGSFSDTYNGPYNVEIDWGDETANDVFSVTDTYFDLTPHTYTAAGTFTVQATITDFVGLTGTGTAEHEVVYVKGGYSYTWLASNVDPTTITLYGYAPLGTPTMLFNIVTDPLHGSLGVPTFIDCRPDDDDPIAECRGIVVFTPTAPSSGEDPFVGDDSFTYTVEDSAGHVSAPPADVYLWLDDNTAPTAEDGAATVLATKPSLFAIYGSDMDGYTDYDIIDQLSFHLDDLPDFGMLSFEGDASDENWFYDDVTGELHGAEWLQMLEYTPNAGATATSDSFTFHVNDTHQDSALTATVTLNLYTPTTLHVNVNDDIVENPAGCTITHCSLREAVLDAQIGDTIDFTLNLPDTITLTSESGGELLIDESIQILGPGADQLAISAGFTDPLMNPYAGFRVFQISDQSLPVEVAISGLTIRDGRAGEGGGVYVGHHASLSLTDCVIGPNNIVAYAGGGISVHGHLLTMENCTVIGNHGTGSEGGAGIFARGSDLIITNSTITGNVTNNFGGGILASKGANITLVHSTISGNTANLDYADYPLGGGGGIHNKDAKKVELWNTIVAGNTDLTNPSDPEGHVQWPDVYGPVTSLGGNLIGDLTGSTGWLLSDFKGDTTTPLDPLLGDLGLYDPGTTPIFSLLIGSQAYDAVECATGVTTDQRGVIRPQGDACDIGAFELIKGDLKISKVFDPLTSGFTDSFALNYDCDDEDHDGTVNLAAGGSETISDIPEGTSCTVSEPILPTPPSGWSFGPATFDPIDRTVTISKAVAEVIVTNTISRDLGELKITKVFDPLTSGFTGTFAIVYDCDGEDHDGTVNLAAGESELVSDIPEGTSCTVSEPVLPTQPTGWTFGTPTFNPATGIVTISETIAEVTVTNTISQDIPSVGELKISKVFDPLTSGFTGTFTINYDCDGEDHDGTVTLAAGGTKSISGIPTGTVCDITEPTLPTPPTGWTFGTPTFNPVTGSVTISKAVAEVIVTNTISQDVALSYKLFLPLIWR